MKYVLVGLAFGLLWAAIQYTRDTVTEPAALLGPILLFGLFGLVMWGLRVLIIQIRKRVK